MIEYDDRIGETYSLELINTLTKALSKKNVELILTDNESIQAINKTFRGIDAPTDVLSFPSADEDKRSPLGSIVIADGFVKDAAKRYGHTPQEEFTLLYIHGLLHLLGYDHECDNGEMRAKEAQIIKKYALPESLIVRTQKEC